MDKCMTIRSDVLVIGGGMAGLAAAIAAAAEGVDVVMATLGPEGKSGATYHDVAEVGAFNAPCADPTDSPEIFYKDIMTAAESMSSPALCRILAEQAEGTLKRISALSGGEHLFEKENGVHNVFQACFSSKPRSHIIHDHFRPLLAVLLQEAKRLGVKFVSSQVCELYVEDGRCWGGYGLDRENQEILFLSKAVVLATGGASQLFLHNMYPRDVMGGGYAMAYRAGAQMTNMEFIQMGIGVAHPFVNLLEHYLWDCYPVLRDCQGKTFLEEFLPENVTVHQAIEDKSKHFPFSTRDHSRHVEIGVQTILNQGRGNKNGNVYLDLDTEVRKSLLAGKNNFARMWKTTNAWYAGKGLNILEQPLEVACFAHAINGGALIDENAQTSIPGLYAVGEVAAGPHGADRLGGNMSLTSQVFGNIAGVHSANRAKNTPVVPDGEAFFNRCSKLYSQYALPADLQTEEILGQIQNLTDHSLLIVRNQTQLENYQKTLSGWKKDLENGKAGKPSREVIQLHHLMTAGEIIAQAAMARKESRGSHYREDYPVLDNSFAKNYIMEGGKASFRTL